MTIQPLELTPIPSDVRETGAEQPETTMGNVIFQVIPGPSDPSEKQHLRLIELSSVLDFWDDPEEDIYTVNDGQPL